jgi:type IV secretion system protein TrbL
MPSSSPPATVVSKLDSDTAAPGAASSSPGSDPMIPAKIASSASASLIGSGSFSGSAATGAGVGAGAGAGVGAAGVVDVCAARRLERAAEAAVAAPSEAAAALTAAAVATCVAALAAAALRALVGFFCGAGAGAGEDGAFTLVLEAAVDTVAGDSSTLSMNCVGSQKPLSALWIQEACLPWAVSSGIFFCARTIDVGGAARAAWRGSEPVLAALWPACSRSGVCACACCTPPHTEH